MISRRTRHTQKDLAGNTEEAGKLETASRAVRHPGASRDHPRALSDKGRTRLPQPRRSWSHRGVGPGQKRGYTEFSHCQESHFKAGGNEERGVPDLVLLPSPSHSSSGQHRLLAEPKRSLAGGTRCPQAGRMRERKGWTAC